MDRLGEAGVEGAGGYEAIPTTGEPATLLASVNSRGIASRLAEANTLGSR